VTKRRVLIWVQHLLGIGHFNRALLLGDAMTKAGLEVKIVSGGMPGSTSSDPDKRVVQLPPLRAGDETFSHLVDRHNQPIDAAFEQRRKDALLACLHDFQPHVLITEMYPFGRRMLRFELEPLLEAARAMRPRPLIVSSVRDILTKKRKTERYQEMAQKILDDYDHVLVHGDPALIPFDTSFPCTDRIADMISYTGYVSAEDSGSEPPPGDGEDEVIISAGGGAVGARLMATAIKAKSHSTLAAHRWRVLAGHNLDAETFQTLQQSATDTMIVERARADFRGLLRRAALSVSQAGYNTVLDIAQAQVPTVLVPFAAARETEQRMRAQCLAARGLAEVVEEAALSPETLARAIDLAWRRGPPGPPVS